MSPQQLLRWYLDAGVDETIGAQPVDRYALSLAQAQTQAQSRPAVMQRPAAATAPAATGRPGSGIPASQPFTPQAAAPMAAEARATASHLAASCSSLSELRAAMEQFDGCILKKTCQRTVFADGNPESRVMLIGEAPGADEDRLGLPFIGASGKLLDKMLASIGLDRSSAYISNVVPWRPPGNRKPEPTEIELCLPFIQRHIELVDPAVLVFLGGAPATSLLGKPEAISRLRGRWWDYQSHGLARPVPAMPTFHPAYLLRTPAHKREAWLDFLAISKKLKTLA
ncbi:MAG TPA: uracil-DNA glycosylase [Candidatus Sulfotelmatobacter sp.]|nr:uracil-DNA glycosylase [Candidatus Sulfotelmatobacter sp.]